MVVSMAHIVLKSGYLHLQTRQGVRPRRQVRIGLLGQPIRSLQERKVWSVRH